MATFRWIIFIPAGFLLSGLVNQIVTYTNKTWLVSFLIGMPLGSILINVVDVFQSIISAAVMTFIPTKISPNHHKIVSIFVSIVVILGWWILYVHATVTMGFNLQATFSAIAIIIGSGGVAYGFYLGEL